MNKEWRYAVYIGNEGDRGYFRDTDKLPNRVVVKINPKDANRLKSIHNIYLIEDVPHPKKKEEKKEDDSNISTDKV